MAAKPIPEGYSNVTPYLTVDDGKAAIEFYKRAFGATELGRMETPDGKVAHAALQIGSSAIMLSDQFPQSSCKTPKELGGTATGVFVYVEDVDEVFRQALDAGATARMQPEDQFWGDRMGTLVDPFGHRWSLATHIEDVGAEEMQRRMEQAFGGGG